MNVQRDPDGSHGSIEPRALAAEFVYCTFPGARYGDRSDLEPLASCCEEEGLSLLVERTRADEAGLDYTTVLGGMTLGVYSGLDDIGLTAAVSSALTRAGISANVVAAYHHDHVFVPADRLEEALDVLRAVSWSGRHETHDAG